MAWTGLVDEAGDTGTRRRGGRRPGALDGRETGVDGATLWVTPLAAIGVVTLVVQVTAGALATRQRPTHDTSITAALVGRVEPRDDDSSRGPSTSSSDDPWRNLRIDGWDTDEWTLWEKRLVERRTSYLERTRATAARWRDVLASLTALGTGVLGIAAGTDGVAKIPADGEPSFYLLVCVALALGLNASFLAAWAATGLPRSFAWVRGAEEMRVQELAHAARSQQRLRVGLVCGALAVLLAAVISLVTFGVHLGGG